ncbi:unnamed protein product [Paramecium primaurelia]|uniref:Uncharacterized protein n=1 Tax=Paramecium primaurelia TaxID=5886 RepID=A0A8S1N8S5_PARPR|nr:unnamed protein product [Paramecium primaurelia]
MQKLDILSFIVAITAAKFVDIHTTLTQINADPFGMLYCLQQRPISKPRHQLMKLKCS